MHRVRLHCLSAEHMPKHLALTKKSRNYGRELMKVKRKTGIIVAAILALALGATAIGFAASGAVTSPQPWSQRQGVVMQKAAEHYLFDNT